MALGQGVSGLGTSPGTYQVLREPSGCYSPSCVLWKNSFRTNARGFEFVISDPDKLPDSLCILESVGRLQPSYFLRFYLFDRQSLGDRRHRDLPSLVHSPNGHDVQLWARLALEPWPGSIQTSRMDEGAKLLYSLLLFSQAHEQGA